MRSVPLWIRAPAVELKWQVVLDRQEPFCHDGTMSHGRKQFSAAASVSREDSGLSGRMVGLAVYNPWHRPGQRAKNNVLPIF